MKNERHNIAFYNSQIAPTYDYTAEMYAEDKKLVNYFLNRKLCNYPLDKATGREDIEQICLMRCWQMRPRYDKNKGAYSHFVFMVCKQVVTYPNLWRNKQQDNERCDLDRVIGEDRQNETRVIELTPNNDPTPEKIVEYYELKSMIDLAIDNIKAPRSRYLARKIIDLYLSGKATNGKEAGQILSLTRERVRQILNKIRVNIAQIQKHGNLFSRQKAEQQLAILNQDPLTKKNRPSW